MSLSDRYGHIRRFLGELLDADSVSVEVWKPAREAVDGESRGEHLGRQLSSYLASGPRANISIFGAEYTGEPVLIRTPRLHSYAAIPFAGAAGYLISESFGERLVIALNRSSHLTFVKAVGEVESQRIFDECQRVPERSRLQVGELATTRAVCGEAFEADGVGKPMTEPVHFLEPDLVDSTDPTSSGHSVSDKHNVTSDSWIHWRVD